MFLFCPNWSIGYILAYSWETSATYTGTSLRQFHMYRIAMYEHISSIYFLFTFVHGTLFFHKIGIDGRIINIIPWP